MESRSSLATPRNADAVAFCPYDGLELTLACGCYELDDKVQPVRRHGHLALYSIDPDGSGLSQAGDASFDVGILDCAWLPASAAASHGTRLLAAATSECDARLYPLQAGEPLLGEPCATMACEDAGDACMALDWSADGGRLAVSSTSGKIYVGQLEGGSDLSLTATWQAHDLEGWAVAFDPKDANTLYTGADDAILKRWDLRAAAEGGEPVALASNRRSHSAGVCCVAPSRDSEHLVATGSYDERARLWDARQLRAPLCETKCDGGVWRLKWHPQRPDVLLGACMHAGFAMLHVGGELVAGAEAQSEATLEIAARYEAHGTGQSLGYGADWCHAPAADGWLLGATCSFYDRALHVWRVAASA